MFSVPVNRQTVVRQACRWRSAPNHRFLCTRRCAARPYTVASFAIDRATGRARPIWRRRRLWPTDGLYRSPTAAAGFCCVASYPGSRSWRSTRSTRRAGFRVSRRKSSRPNPRRTASWSIRRTSIAMRRASAATSSWNGNSTPPPAGCRRTRRTDRCQARQTDRGIWRSTRTPIPLSDYRDHGAHRRLCHRSRRPGPSRESKSSTPCRPISMSSRPPPTSMSLPMAASSTAASANPAPSPGSRSTRQPANCHRSAAGRPKRPRAASTSTRAAVSCSSAGLILNAMTVHRIDPQSGALSVAHQYPMGKMPNWVEIVDLR